MCQDRIAQLAWCPRSEKIACRLHGRDFLQVPPALCMASLRLAGTQARVQQWTLCTCAACGSCPCCARCWVEPVGRVRSCQSERACRTEPSPAISQGSGGATVLAHLLAHVPHVFLQVWSIRDNAWRCKVHQGPSGAGHCQWSPDGSTLVVASDFSLRLSAWNLRTRAVVHLKGPKGASQGLQFSPDGRQLATLEVLALAPMLMPVLIQGLQGVVLGAPGFGRLAVTPPSQPCWAASSGAAEHARCSCVRHGHRSSEGHVVQGLTEQHASLAAWTLCTPKPLCQVMPCTACSFTARCMVQRSPSAHQHCRAAAAECCWVQNHSAVPSLLVAGHAQTRGQGRTPPCAGSPTAKTKAPRKMTGSQRNAAKQVCCTVIRQARH